MPSLWIQERVDAVTLKGSESHKESESHNCNNMKRTSDTVGLYLTFHRIHTVPTA